jgi:hypothetical protein
MPRTVVAVGKSCQDTYCRIEAGHDIRNRDADLLRTGALLAVAAVATLLPWTRFSTGSGFAGAWAIDVRWSMLAASAAVIGLALWFAFGRRPSVARTVAIVAGAVVVVGSLFAVLNPPPFTKPAVAPWVSLFAGAGAAIAGAYARTRSAAPHV